MINVTDSMIMQRRESTGSITSIKLNTFKIKGILVITHEEYISVGGHKQFIFEQALSLSKFVFKTFLLLLSRSGALPPSLTHQSSKHCPFGWSNMNHGDSIRKKQLELDWSCIGTHWARTPRARVWSWTKMKWNLEQLQESC